MCCTEPTSFPAPLGARAQRDCDVIPMSTSNNIPATTLAMATDIESDIDTLIERVGVEISCLESSTEQIEEDFGTDDIGQSETRDAVERARQLNEYFRDLSAKLKKRQRIVDLLTAS